MTAGRKAGGTIGGVSLILLGIVVALGDLYISAFAFDAGTHNAGPTVILLSLVHLLGILFVTAGIVAVRSGWQAPGRRHFPLGRFLAGAIVLDVAVIIIFPLLVNVGGG